MLLRLLAEPTLNMPLRARVGEPAAEDPGCAVPLGTPPAPLAAEPAEERCATAPLAILLRCAVSLPCGNGDGVRVRAPEEYQQHKGTCRKRMCSGERRAEAGARLASVISDTAGVAERLRAEGPVPPERSVVRVTVRASLSRNRRQHSCSTQDMRTRNAHSQQSFGAKWRPVDA